MERFAGLASGPFGRFLTSGAFNTLVTYLLYLALLPWLAYRVSYTIAYASGIALAYVLNRYLVFRQPGGRAGPFLVALIYCGQYLASLGLMSLWVGWLAAPSALAPLFAIAVTLPLIYVLNRRVFSGTAAEAPPPSPPMPLLTPIGSALRRVAFGVLIGLPVLSIVLNAVAWLQYGIDLPFYDDWRGYDTGNIDSLELPYLFRAVNDTLTPIGFGLDALAQRFLDGNSIVYQFLSMVTVLGLLLLLQWKLLMSALGDRVRAAVCFVLTLPMLQPGSYWGRENMAYQQALPLVFTLLALWMGVSRPLRDRWNLPLIFLLGMLSGLSYISGAFGALAAGAGMVLAALLCRPHAERRALVRGASALALAGAVASAIQVYYALLPSKGGTHTVGKSLALPIESDFWFFYLGKLGRSLLLPAHSPVASLAVVAGACVLIVLIALLVVRAGRRDSDNGQALRVCVIFAAIAAMVLTYLLLVSAGRTHYRPAEVQASLDVFSFAFQRFHFFWATLLWPWLAAGAMVAWERSGSVGSRLRGGGALVSVLVVFGVLGMLRLGALDHFERHRRESSFRRGTVECLMEQLQKGEGIRCEEFNLPDLTPAYIYARDIGASFVRYFPVLPLELGLDPPSPWFRLSRDGGRTQLRNIDPLAGPFLRAGDDAQLHIDIANTAGMASCVMIDVRGMLKVEHPDTVRLYFRPLGQQEFSEASSRSLPVQGVKKASVFSFRLEHPVGFESTMRLDPVASSQRFELAELEVRCRLKSRYDTISPFYAITDGTSPGKLESMKPLGDGPGRFRAGDNAQVLFRTGHRHNMASCRLLEVQAIYRVQAADAGKLYFRPKGAGGFSEQHSVSLPVAPEAQARAFSFVAHSAAGFEDGLRFDPVERPQDVQFEDIKVKCLKRIDRLERAEQPRPHG